MSPWPILPLHPLGLHYRIHPISTPCPNNAPPHFKILMNPALISNIYPFDVFSDFVQSMGAFHSMT